ncbi:MAG: hypothetical protein ACI8ZM_002471 [Crocinitomix sp.]|jgi:hypothetical protein
MFAQKVEIEVKAMTKAEAQKKADLAAKIANALDLESLQILQVASARPEANQKVKNFRGMLESM